VRWTESIPLDQFETGKTFSIGEWLELHISYDLNFQNLRVEARVDHIFLNPPPPVAFSSTAVVEVCNHHNNNTMIYQSIDQTVDSLLISLVGNYYYAVLNSDGNDEYILIVNVVYNDTDFHICKAYVGEYATSVNK